MWVVILLMKQDQFIIVKKKKNKGIYGTASNKDIKELKEEGIKTEIMPWFKDNNN